ncbi:zinc-ribbon domain-containing protein [Paraburkholderia sp. C35]|uniref:double zinc ribbon domain-containing protein n=1 Tax=Paraburkholderia sp. C35 TaxID=2126993 RepID=UPI001EF62863|nr:zinc-ribbon domain-containing protein [Paraburkholderia sp. C35]
MTPATRAERSCPKCGAANATEARFCSQCATSLVPRSCASCSQALAHDAKFCGQCGAPVVA